MEIGRPLSSICRGTGTWSGGVLKALPNNYVLKQDHVCPHKKALKLPTITAPNPVPKTFATRHGALLLFSDVYEAWRNQLKETGVDNEEEEEVTDLVKQLKTLKDLRTLVLSFGLDDESVIKGISAILHDDSFVRVRPGYSANRYTSSAVRLWDPKLVDKYLENDGINKSVVERYFELLLPDVTVNGVVLKDTLLGSKPRNYVPSKLTDHKAKGHGVTDTDEVAKTELRKESNVMVLPKIDFTDSSQLREDPLGSVHMHNIKQNSLDPNQKKFWNNYENLSYDEKAHLLLRMLVSRSEEMSGIHDKNQKDDDRQCIFPELKNENVPSPHLSPVSKSDVSDEKDKDDDRKCIFPELSDENVNSPLVNKTEIRQKSASSIVQLPPISKVDVKSTLKGKVAKNKRPTDKTKPLPLPDEIERLHQIDPPKFVYRPTKLTAYGISYSDESPIHHQKYLNGLVIQGMSFNKNDDIPQVDAEQSDARPLSFPSSFAPGSSDDLLKRYIKDNAQYNNSTDRSDFAQHNSRASSSSSNFSGHPVNHHRSVSKPSSCVMGSDTELCAGSNISMTTDDLERPASLDTEVQSPHLKSHHIMSDFSQIETYIQDSKTDMCSEQLNPFHTEKGNAAPIDCVAKTSSESRNDKRGSTPDTLKVADEVLKAELKMDTSYEGTTSSPQDDTCNLNNSHGLKVPNVNTMPDQVLNTVHNDTITNILVEDTLDIPKGDDETLHYDGTKAMGNVDIPNTDAVLPSNLDIPSVPSLLNMDSSRSHPLAIANDPIPSVLTDLNIRENNSSSVEVKSPPPTYTSPSHLASGTIDDNLDDTGLHIPYENKDHSSGGNQVSLQQDYGQQVHIVPEANDVVSKGKGNVMVNEDDNMTVNKDNIVANNDMHAVEYKLLGDISVENINAECDSSKLNTVGFAVNNSNDVMSVNEEDEKGDRYRSGSAGQMYADNDRTNEGHMGQTFSSDEISETPDSISVNNGYTAERNEILLTNLNQVKSEGNDVIDHASDGDGELGGRKGIQNDVNKESLSKLNESGRENDQDDAKENNSPNLDVIGQKDIQDDAKANNLSSNSNILRKNENGMEGKAHGAKSSKSNADSSVILPANDIAHQPVKDKIQAADGGVNDSRNEVELGTTVSISEEKEPEPFRLGTAMEEKPVFLDSTLKKSNKKLPPVKKKNSKKNEVSKMTNRESRHLIEKPSVGKKSDKNMKPPPSPKASDSAETPSSLIEEGDVRIHVEDLDDNIVEEEKKTTVQIQLNDENEKKKLLAKKLAREKSAVERRAEVERKRKLLVEKRRLEKEEKLRETEAYILKAQEEDRRNEELQKKMEEELRRQEEERLREQEMEKERFEAGELERKRKEGEAERLKKKKLAEEEAQRKKMEILIAQRQMEVEFKKKQEEMARAIEADMAEKERALMQQMEEDERRQYEENKKMEEELRRKEDEERAQLLELKRKVEEERRERELEELLRLESKQLFSSSSRLDSCSLEIQQQVSRAYTYSYFDLWPLFLGAPLPSPKKGVR